MTGPKEHQSFPKTTTFAGNEYETRLDGSSNWLEIKSKINPDQTYHLYLSQKTMKAIAKRIGCQECTELRAFPCPDCGVGLELKIEDGVPEIFVEEWQPTPPGNVLVIKGQGEPCVGFQTEEPCEKSAHVVVLTSHTAGDPTARCLCLACAYAEGYIKLAKRRVYVQ